MQHLHAALRPVWLRLSLLVQQNLHSMLSTVPSVMWL
jgi:hypothetical protein